MINLLPPKEKKYLKKKTFAERLSLLLFFILIVFLAMICFFLSFHSYLSFQAVPEVKKLEEVEQFLKSKRVSFFRTTIQETNSIVSAIQNFFLAQPSIADLFTQLSSITPKAVYLNDFSFQKTDKKQGRVQISGRAESRRDLFAFKQSLESQDNFEEVEFSLASWTAPVRPHFSLTFTLKPKKK